MVVLITDKYPNGLGYFLFPRDVKSTNEMQKCAAPIVARDTGYDSGVRYYILVFYERSCFLTITRRAFVLVFQCCLLYN